MKLLLTSGGITNKSIANALFELAGKRPENISVAFIPTAANPSPGDKGWLIDQYVDLQKQNFRSIDIVDISALDIANWRPRLEAADVLLLGGGINFYLMEWINRSGLAAILPDLLKDKVYVGLSAGSMVTGPQLLLSISQIVYEEEMDKTENIPGLGLVDWYFIPHLNSPDFPLVRKEKIEAIMTGTPETIYLMDDDSALQVVDGKVEVISEGEWLVIEGK